MNGAKRAACLAAVLFVLLAFVFRGAKSIICYKCNSKYDPRCGDPFSPYTIGLIDCNITGMPEHLQDENAAPVLCRKSVQRIHGSVRIVRDCGYLSEGKYDNLECFSRPGSKNIDVTYCSCTSDYCNHGSTTASTTTTTTVMVVAMAVTAIGFFLDIQH